MMFSSKRLVITLFTYAAPLLSVILMMLGNGFFISFISLSLDYEGFSHDSIGWIQSAYYLGMLLGAFKMERIIRRIGHVQALMVFGSVATSTILLQALSYDFTSWLLLRFIAGVCLAAIYIVIESWMLEQSETNSRGMILSLYMISLYGAQSISQQFLSVFSIASAAPYLVAALLISLSTIPVGLSTKKIVIPDDAMPLKFLKIIKISPFGSGNCFISGMVLSAILSFFPLYALEKGISPAHLMSLTIAGGVLLQWPLGCLSDVFERRKVLLTVVLACTLTAAILFFYTGSSAAIMLSLAFIIGGFSFTLYPLGVTQACDHLEPHQITKATSYLLIFYGLGAVVGPIVAAWVIKVLGIYFLFFYFIILLGALSLLGSYAVFKRKKIAIEDQNMFLPLTRTTPIAYEMDPRSEEMGNS